MTRRIISIGAGLAVLAILLWYFRAPISAGLALASARQGLTALLNDYGGWAKAMSSLMLILQVFLAFIPGQLLMIVNGYVFGFWKGLIITWTSLVLAGEVAFFLARRYGRPLAIRFVAPAMLDKWDHYSFNQSIVFYVVTMLLPHFPNNAMCYVAGLTDALAEIPGCQSAGALSCQPGTGLSRRIWQRPAGLGMGEHCEPGRSLDVGRLAGPAKTVGG
jgi:uncharacterized membrane protein YdjX (TVP38/TMEM64 family)